MYGDQLCGTRVRCYDSLEYEIYFIAALLYDEALLCIVDGNLRGVALLETDGKFVCLELSLIDGLAIGADLLEDTLYMTCSTLSRE